MCARAGSSSTTIRRTTTPCESSTAFTNDRSLLPVGSHPDLATSAHQVLADPWPRDDRRRAVPRRRRVISCRRSLGSRLHRADRFTPDVEAVPPADRCGGSGGGGHSSPSARRRTRERRAVARRRGLDAGDTSPTCGRRSSTASVTPRTSTRSASSCGGCSARPATSPPTPPIHGSTILSRGCPPRECPERCPCRDSATAGPPAPAASSARTFCRSNNPCAKVAVVFVAIRYQGESRRRDGRLVRRSASAGADTSLPDVGPERRAPGSSCFWSERGCGRRGAIVGGRGGAARTSATAGASTLAIRTRRLRHLAVLGAPPESRIDVSIICKHSG